MATAMAAASGVAMEEIGSDPNSRSNNSRIRPSRSPGRHLFKKDRVEKNAFGEQNENTNLSIVDAAMASAANKSLHAKKPLFQIDPRTSKHLSYWDSITGAPTPSRRCGVRTRAGSPGRLGPPTAAASHGRALSPQGSLSSSPLW
tara:strand:- start:342 stop:776 length:435 start_codon:yes stop_codon:yes gene_type:complete